MKEKTNKTIQDLKSDIFQEMGIEPLSESIQNNTEEQPKNRMAELVKSMSQPNEIYKEKIKVVDQEKLQQENKRLSQIARIKRVDELHGQNTTQFTNTVSAILSPSGTVDDFYQNKEFGYPVNNTNVNSDNNNNVGPAIQQIQPAEGLALAINRVLNSGAPINDIEFYAEVNWHLTGLGFRPVNPNDIKQALLKMINS